MRRIAADGRTMRTPPERETISDYSRFDFASLWRGRENVTEVEREVVAEELEPVDRRRVLDIGTGFGRLLPTLTRLTSEIVATDFDAARLSEIPDPPPGVRLLRVAANVYHLPFVGGAFTCGTMVRVHHHLADPGAALREVARVLRAGSGFVVSYNPKPSAGTIVLDLGRALRHPGAARPRTITFSAGTTRLDPAPFPVYISNRREFLRVAIDSGLRPRREIGTGFEEFRPLRSLPPRWVVRVGNALASAPMFPCRFVLLYSGGNETRPLPSLEEILACPRCSRPRPGWGRGDAPSCPDCGFNGRRSGEVLDLRFVPEGASRWEAGSTGEDRPVGVDPSRRPYSAAPGRP